jgi:hypothetical protein
MIKFQLNLFKSVLDFRKNLLQMNKIRLCCSSFTRAQVLHNYKHLFKYLNNKNTKGNFEPLKQTLRNEFKARSVIENTNCESKGEMFMIASTYLNYLDSTKETLRLYSIYCKGERTTEEAANIVGLKLPKLYQEEPKK